MPVYFVLFGVSLFSFYMFDIFAHDITVGALFTPGAAHIDRDNADWLNPTRPGADDIALLRPLAVGQLINQIDKFIFLLQSEGILGHYPNVDIIINETSIIFGDFPVLINNYLMVPAPEIFEEMGMTVEIDDRGRITAAKGNVSIVVSLHHTIVHIFFRKIHNFIGFF